MAFALPAAQRERVAVPPVLEVVLPVYNEERQLRESVSRLRTWLDASFPVPTLVTIADNASTDGTPAVAADLAATLPGVRSVRLEQKGRGLALRTVWSASTAQVVAYMDVDLATGLDALLPLVAPLLSGHSEVAIGSRLAPGARVVRGTRREGISRVYNFLLHLVLRSRFSDAQCGFKALRTDAARALLPLVEDNRWFFDTELLVLAERNGLRIHEVPVDWVDDPDSSVDIAGTAAEDLAGVARLLVQLAAGHGRADLPVSSRRGTDLRRYAGTGVVSTVVWLCLFVLLRSGLGAYGANLVSLLVCCAAAAAFQRRFSVRLDDRRAAVTVGAIGFGVSALITTLALVVGRAFGIHSEVGQIIVLLVGTGVAALGRLLASQAWLLRRAGAATGPQGR